MKMNNKKKAVLIAMGTLVITLGTFAIKNYLIAPVGGFKVPTSIDMILALPAIPFVFLSLLLPEMSPEVTTMGTGIVTIIFWLTVAYFIGNHMDKKQKNK